MSDDEPTDVIAPRDGLAYEPHDFLSEMLQGAYADGVVLEYHGLELQCQKFEGGPHTWTVWGESGLIETINLDAVATITELQAILDEIVAYGPADREEWINR